MWHQFMKEKRLFILQFVMLDLREMPSWVVHDRKKPFKCDTCDVSYTTKQSLRGNYESVHEWKKPCNVILKSELIGMIWILLFKCGLGRISWGQNKQTMDRWVTLYPLKTEPWCLTINFSYEKWRNSYMYLCISFIIQILL